MKFSFYILTLLLVLAFPKHGTAAENRDYFYYPKALDAGDFSVILGLGLTKLPNAVVEEEINQSPMPGFKGRVGLPWNLSISTGFQSNYIANHGFLSLQWSFLNYKFSMAWGNKFSAWFGHLELEAFHIKSEGFSINPYISIGYDYDDYFISMEIESQSNTMFTQIEERELSKFNEVFTGIALSINIEQPLWNNHWVALGVKMNYTKFYYQSWLSYNTLDEFLLYPEFKFAFIL